jgi:hypothetical protein
MSEFAKSNALYVFIALILFGFAFRRFYRTEKGRTLLIGLFCGYRFLVIC